MALGGALGRAWAPVTPRHFVWQAWHKLASTVVSRGRRGTNSHPPSFCVAGVGQMALGGALGRAWAPVTPRHFAWQAWHKLASTVVSRGRHGTNSHLLSFCVAGVGQMALGGALGRAWAPVTPRHFVWQAWHNLTSTFVSRGRRGTNSHLLSFCVAGVGQMALGGALGRAWAPVTPRHFAWQAWHNLTSTFVSRGRRGTMSHPPSFCVAGVGQIISHTPSQTIFHTPSFTHRLCHTPSFTHNFVTRHLSHTTLSHTNFVTHHLSHTNFVTHHLSHTSLSHPTFHTPSFTHHIVAHHLSQTLFHTPLCHIPSLTHRFVTHHFVTHHIVTHHLSHITLSHTIFHTPLCHIPSLTHRFVTHHFVTHHFVTHHLSHTIFHTPLCHTPSFTHRHRPSFHTIFHTPSFTQHCLAPSFTTPSFTHHFVTHHLSPHHLSHTTLSHTIFHHTIFNTTLSHTIFRQTIFHTPICHTPSFPQLCHTPSFTHNFRTHHLAHTTLSHTLSFLVTHQLSHTTLSHTTLFYFSVLHHLLCLSFLPRPRYNMWCFLFKEVVLWGYPVL